MFTIQPITITAIGVERISPVFIPQMHSDVNLSVWRIIDKVCNLTKMTTNTLSLI